MKGKTHNFSYMSSDSIEEERSDSCKTVESIYEDTPPDTPRKEIAEVDFYIKTIIPFSSPTASNTDDSVWLRELLEAIRNPQPYQNTSIPGPTLRELIYGVAPIDPDHHS